MTKQFKPLLASPVEFDRLDYEDLWLSAKLDGIRAIVINGTVVSRKLLPIPNEHVQKAFGHLEGYDGELICGEPTSPTVYRDTYSAVMSKAGTPHVTFYVFDHIGVPDDDYVERFGRLNNGPSVRILGHTPIYSAKDIEALEVKYLGQGYEGVMLRKARGPNSRYKFGRATAKSNTLLKLKRFHDAEYKVIGFEERMHNANEAVRDALGNLKRSSHQENKVGRGDLGALILEHEAGPFRCGSGFTDKDREHIWNNQANYMGSYAKIKSFLIGVKDAPRFPVWLGWRAKEDM